MAEKLPANFLCNLQLNVRLYSKTSVELYFLTQPTILCKNNGSRGTVAAFTQTAAPYIKREMSERCIIDCGGGSYCETATIAAASVKKEKRWTCAVKPVL